MRKLLTTTAVSAAILTGSAAITAPVLAQTEDPPAQEQDQGAKHPGARKAVVKALRISADTIGISVQDLGAALRDGQTIADVAAANGVDVNEVIDAVLAPINSRIEQAVANGRISAEKGAQLSELAAQGVTLAANGEYGTVISWLRSHRR